MKIDLQIDPTIYALFYITYMYLRILIGASDLTGHLTKESGNPDIPKEDYGIRYLRNELSVKGGIQYDPSI